MQSDHASAFAAGLAGAAGTAVDGRINAGPGFSLTDIARFEAAMRSGSPTNLPPAGATFVESGRRSTTADLRDSAGLKAVVGTLNQMNDFAQHLGQAARAIQAQGEMSPGDMLMLTVRCQELLFYCELTANVANRSSEGVQQLFRQQS